MERIALRTRLRRIMERKSLHPFPTSPRGKSIVKPLVVVKEHREEYCEVNGKRALLVDGVKMSSESATRARIRFLLKGDCDKCQCRRSKEPFYFTYKGKNLGVGLCRGCDGKFEDWRDRLYGHKTKKEREKPKIHYLDKLAKGLGYKNYGTYLSSPHWEKVKSRVKTKTCYCCQAVNTELHLHHITYERLGSELDDDLVTVCDTCHMKIHSLVTTGLPLYYAHTRVREAFKDSAGFVRATVRSG